VCVQTHTNTYTHTYNIHTSYIHTYINSIQRGRSVTDVHELLKNTYIILAYIHSCIHTYIHKQYSAGTQCDGRTGTSKQYIHHTHIHAFMHAYIHEQYSAGTQCDGRTGRSMEYHFVCEQNEDQSVPSTVCMHLCIYV
jgi:hypothetical protein